ncbi:uncharacterized protein LOC131633040 [Vicia villosa]|uniref:uncharacterized protein LOC131633040 n=1 Tax=Vicia villosa TaxID=3911 RepID=UPI00273B5E31|nr:uncharacterized protein LOC131633040 [Vicia villosa]
MGLRKKPNFLKCKVVSQVSEGTAVPADVPAIPVHIGPSPSVPIEGPSPSTTSSRRPQDDDESSSKTPSDRRYRRASSSTPMQVTEDVGSPVPPLELHEEADAAEGTVFYLGDPIDFSQLIEYADHSARCIWDVEDRDLLKFYNHERWLLETLSFHLPHGEVTITLDNIACLLYIPIRGTLLGHGRLLKEEVMEMLIKELGVDPEDALEEVERTCGPHVRFHFLTRKYEVELLAEQDADGDEAGVNILRQQVWILQHFPDIIGWGEASDYTKAMSRGRAFIPLRGNPVSDPYRSYFDRMGVKDVQYNCYANHYKTLPFDNITLYSRWLAFSSTIIVSYLPECVMWQFGYQHTIPRHSSVSTSIAMTHR